MFPQLLFHLLSEDNTLLNESPVLLNGSMNLPEADVNFETGKLFYIINIIMP